VVEVAFLLDIVGQEAESARLRRLVSFAFVWSLAVEENEVARGCFDEFVIKALLAIVDHAIFVGLIVA